MAGEGEHIEQSEIEELLKKSKQDKPAAGVTPPAESDQALRQDEIESLLKDTSKAQAAVAKSEDAGKMQRHGDIESAKTGKAAATAARPGAVQAPAQVMLSADEDSIAHGDVEFLLRQAEQALASVDHPLPPPSTGVAPFKLEEFHGAPPSMDVATLELIRDVELELRIELGRTQMYLEDVLRLRKGSVVPLDKLAGDPVDVYVNGRLVARGEVLVLNDNFCVRVNELLAGQAARAG